MDGQQFDLISKWLATRESRRATFRGLAAGALALGLGRLSLEAALADCKKLGQKCAKDGDCCAGAQCQRNTCVCKGGNSTCGDHLCCPPDRVCVGTAANPLDPPSDPDDLMKCICPTGFEEDADGKCVCKHTCGEFCCQPEDGEVCCGSRRGQKQCVLIDSSHNNCGACGNACPKDRICKGGTCVCPYPTVECDGECVDLTDDAANCGRCGSACPADRICQGGECVCGPDFLHCEGKCIPKDGGCCSDSDCSGSGYGSGYYCCSGRGCDYFDRCAYGCVDDTYAGDPDDDPPGFIICSVL
jgi:hypothetical protein